MREQAEQEAVAFPALIHAAATTRLSSERWNRRR